MNAPLDILTALSREPRLHPAFRIHSALRPADREYREEAERDACDSHDPEVCPICGYPDPLDCVRCSNWRVR